MSKNTKIIISVVLGGAFLWLMIFNIYSLREDSALVETFQQVGIVPTEKLSQPAQVVKTIEIKTEGAIAVLEINGTSYESEIENETSVYDFMKKLKSEGKIQFTDTYYIAMGKFIDSINGIKGNGNEAWIYYVNGKKAEIGVSNFKIHPGDVVSWKYEKSY